MQGAATCFPGYLPIPKASVRVDGPFDSLMELEEQKEYWAIHGKERWPDKPPSLDWDSPKATYQRNMYESEQKQNLIPGNEFKSS